MVGSIKDLVIREKEQAINFILIIFAVAGTFVTAFSLLRAFDIGMEPALWAQLVLVISVVIIALLRKQLPVRFKVIYAVGINLLVGMAGILNFGLVDGSVMLLISGIIIAASLGGTRFAVFTVLLCALVLIILMVLVQMSLWTFNVDANAYMYQLSSWLVFVLAFAVLSILTSYIIGKMSDIAYSNLVLLEEQSQKLEQSNKTKDRLFQMIAHDLRTPFQGLISGLEMFLDENSVFDKIQKDKLLRSMLNDSINTFSMLENLLYWSRAQAGDLKLEKKYLDLARLLESALNPYLGIAERKKISIKVEASPGLLFYGDEGSLKIVLGNLISNAIKFTASNGELVISSKIVKDKIHIVVSDNGVGIDPALLDKIFDPSCQFSTRGTSNESGTGLGLKICYELLLKNGGEISANTNSKGGTDFLIILPVQADNRGF
jgi:signal transduction histidine kinase